jgi:molybdopterin synthase catalytic subunit
VTVPLLAIGPAPLALEPLVSAVAADSDGVDGAIVTFLGLARNHNQGRLVLYLEY